MILKMHIYKLYIEILKLKLCDYPIVENKKISYCVIFLITLNKNLVIFIYYFFIKL